MVLDILSSWFAGQGKKPAVFLKDAFVMMLTVIKHGSTWKFHAINFAMSTSSFYN